MKVLIDCQLEPIGHTCLENGVELVDKRVLKRETVFVCARVEDGEQEFEQALEPLQAQLILRDRKGLANATQLLEAMCCALKQ